ncbi:MAG: zinc ABC transporter substrate-binding protein [Phycisphaerales bacterium]|nr:zinc ABC transporter substrate-binding protein [Phycisphaerales bacterium]
MLPVGFPCQHRMLLGLVVLGLPTVAVGADERPVIYTSAHPIAYFAERIAGDALRVVNPVPADEDPALWVPSENLIAEFQKADLILLNGAEFEKWVSKVTLPRARTVSTAHVFRDQWLELEGGLTHSHGPGGEHTHEGTDGYTWLDPNLAIRQADEIRTAFERNFPSHREKFRDNFAALKQDLEELDARFRKLAPRMKDIQLLANHPIWNYLAKRYEWKLKSFHFETDELDPDELKKLAEFLKTTPAKYMLWEDEPDQDVAKGLRDAHGVEPILFPPGVGVDPDEAKKGLNYLQIMRGNLERLEKLFGA